MIVLFLCAPRCSTAPPCSNHTAPNATFDVQQGCVGYYCAMQCDPGFLNCDNDESNGCETPITSPPPHAQFSADTGTCTIVCDPGFSNCDEIESNGCETASSTCSSQPDSGEPASPHVIATLAAQPLGLAVCAGRELFFDGPTLRAIDSQSLALVNVATSPSPPADGIACDGTYAYWVTPSDADADASPNGVLYRVAIQSGTPEVVVSDFDFRSGIDVADAGVLAMTGSGVVLAQGDAATDWMPASPTGVYKPFALTQGDSWSLAGATLYRRSSSDADASAESWIDDAGLPTAVFASSGDAILARHVSGVADDLALVMSDAGGVTSFAAVDPIVATSSGAPAIVASDGTIYVVQSGLFASVLFSTLEHVVDVAVDGTWAVWTTRGQNQGPSVWRGKLQ